MKKGFLLILFSITAILFAAQAEWDEPFQFNSLEYENLHNILELDDGDIFYIYTKGSEDGPQIVVRKTDSQGNELLENPIEIFTNNKFNTNIEAKQLSNGNIAFVWNELESDIYETKLALTNQYLEEVTTPVTIHTYDSNSEERCESMLDINIFALQNSFYIGLAFRDGIYFSSFANDGNMIWEAEDTSDARYSMDLFPDSENGIYIVFNNGVYQHISSTGIISEAVNSLLIEKIIENKIFTYNKIYNMSHEIIFDTGNDIEVDNFGTIYEMVDDENSILDSIKVYTSDLELVNSYEAPEGLSSSWRANPDRVGLYYTSTYHTSYVFENGEFHPFEYIENSRIWITPSSIIMQTDELNFRHFAYEDHINIDVELSGSYFNEYFTDLLSNDTDSEEEYFIVGNRDFSNNNIFRVYNQDKELINETSVPRYIEGYQYYEHNGNPVISYCYNGLKILYDGELILDENGYDYGDFHGSYNGLKWYSIYDSGEYKLVAINHEGILWETESIYGGIGKVSMPYIYSYDRIIKIDVETGDFLFNKPLTGGIASWYNTDKRLYTNSLDHEITAVTIASEDGDVILNGEIVYGESYHINEEYIIVYNSEPSQIKCDVYDHELNHVTTNIILETDYSSRHFYLEDNLYVLTKNFTDEVWYLFTIHNGELEFTQEFDLYTLNGEDRYLRYKIIDNSHFILFWDESYQNSGSNKNFYSILYNTNAPVSTEEIPTPEKLSVKNYPNPFSLGNSRNAQTTIEFNLPQAQNVEVSIYNIKGQKVKNLLKDDLREGTHSISWNGENSNNEKVASGVYFYKVKTDRDTTTKKLLILK